jgi:acid phosphatase family membrane protein YuiD
MNDLWSNASIWIPIIIWFLVQSFKVVYEIIKYKKLNIRRLWGSGGMPSSHSALVCSLTTVVGLIDGFGSTNFAIAVILASVVMYDAAGVRRAAGKQAKVLNQIIENEGDINVQEKLIELLGHTPKEVLVGAIVGIFGSMLIYNWIF